MRSPKNLRPWCRDRSHENGMIPFVHVQLWCQISQGYVCHILLLIVYILRVLCCLWSLKSHWCGTNGMLCGEIPRKAQGKYQVTADATEKGGKTFTLNRDYIINSWRVGSIATGQRRQRQHRPWLSPSLFYYYIVPSSPVLLLVKGTSLRLADTDISDVYNILPPHVFLQATSPYRWTQHWWREWRFYRPRAAFADCTYSSIRHSRIYQVRTKGGEKEVYYVQAILPK